MREKDKERGTENNDKRKIFHHFGSLLEKLMTLQSENANCQKRLVLGPVCMRDITMRSPNCKLGWEMGRTDSSCTRGSLSLVSLGNGCRITAHNVPHPKRDGYNHLTGGQHLLLCRQPGVNAIRVILNNPLYLADLFLLFQHCLTNWASCSCMSVCLLFNSVTKKIFLEKHLLSFKCSSIVSIEANKQIKNESTK